MNQARLLKWAVIICQFPLKMLFGGWLPPYPEPHFSQYKFKSNQNLTLDLYHELTRNRAVCVCVCVCVYEFLDLVELRK